MNTFTEKDSSILKNLAYSIGHEVVYSCTSLIPLQLSHANIYRSCVGPKYVNQHALIWYFVDKIHSHEYWMEMKVDESLNGITF